MDERTQAQGGYLRAMHDSSYIVRMSELFLDYKTLRYKLYRTENNKKRYMIMQIAQIGDTTYAEIVEAKEFAE